MQNCRRWHAGVELQMACIAAAEPAWNEEQASEALNSGFMLEHPDVYDELQVPADMIAEVLVPAEAKKLHEYSAALSQAQAQRNRQSQPAR